MAVSIGSGFALMKKLPLDDRTLFDTVDDMVKTQEIFLPDMGYAFVKENGKMYVFNRDNDILDGFGKWREFVGGGDAKLTQKLVASTTIGMVSEGQTFDAGTSLEDIIKGLLAGKKFEEDDFYYGTVDSRDVISLYQFAGSTSSVCKINANNQYIVFATRESLGDFNVQDANGFPYNNDFDKTTLTHNGIVYTVMVGKYRITATDFEYKLTFK